MWKAKNFHLKNLLGDIQYSLKNGYSSHPIAASFHANDLQITYTSQIKKIPESSTLLFGQTTTDHMFEAHWRKDRGWNRPLINPYHPLILDPAAKCLHYSLEIFEGMKAYHGVDGKIRLFRPTENFKRMTHSAVRSCLPTFDVEEMRKCLHKYVELEKDWIPKDKDCSLYLRPTLIGTEPSLGVAYSGEALLYVISCPVGAYFPSGMKPVSLLADPSYVRAWPGGAGNAKMGSNYGPTIYIQQQAVKKNCQQVLWLFGDDCQITEAGTMNIFIYLVNDQGEKELITPPLNEGVILPGVVRKSIIELTKSWGEFKVTERKINMAELVEAHQTGRLLEVFGSGTACVVCPVERILFGEDNIYLKTMESKQPNNPLFQRIYETLNDIFYGKKDSEWTEVVC